LVRLYEVSGRKDSVTLTAPLEIVKAELVDLDGKAESSLAPKGNAVSFEVPPYRIQGIKLKLKG
jgi:hypothetical protein